MVSARVVLACLSVCLSVCLSGPLGRVLAHFRLSHHPNDCPVDFVEENRLVQCAYCRQWFTRMGQHSSKCPASRISSSVRSTDVGVTPTHSSVASEAAPSRAAVGGGSLAQVTVVSAQSSSSIGSQDQVDAWAWLDTITADEILKCIPARTIQYVQPVLRSSFFDCCMIALHKIEENPEYDGGWKLLMLLPRMLLNPHPRGKYGIREVKAIHQRFLHFHWKELLHLQKTKPHVKSGIKKNQCAVDWKCKAALKSIKSGELSRAARILTSNGLALPSEGTVESLKRKHPIRSEDIVSNDVDASMSISLKKTIFLEAIKKSPRGSAPGPSGWRYEHVRLLLGNSLTSDLLFEVCCLIAKGQIPPSMVPLITSSRLIALPKGNGDVRPIAIGETLRRLSAKAICLQLRSSFSSYFSPQQHGVATRGGSEMLVHHVQRLLEENPEFGVLKTDISNAFNCVSRKHLLQEVAAHFSELYGHVKQMYGQSSPLLYFNGHSTCMIESQEGVQQGDPLGPALFSLAIHPIICKAQEKSTTTTVLAYLDDIFVVGPSDQAEDLLGEMKSDLARINLNICDRKCEYYLPPMSMGTFHQFVSLHLVWTYWVFQWGVIVMSNHVVLRLLLVEKSSVLSWET